MRYLLFIAILLLAKQFLTAQTPDVSPSNKQRLQRALLIMEDESKEDSILILATEAVEQSLKDNSYTAFVRDLITFSRDIYSFGYLESADSILQFNLTYLQEAFPDRHDLMADLWYERARAFYLYQEYTPALENIFRCLAHREKASLNQTPENSDDYNLLGLLQMETGQLEAAKSTFHQALSICQQQGPDASYETSKVLSNLGTLYIDLGLPNRALENLQNAYNIRRDLLGAEHASLASILQNMGVIAKNKGNYQQSIEAFQQALNILGDKTQQANERIGEIYYNLGEIYAATGHFVEGESYFKNALHIFSQLPKEVTNKKALVIRGLANLRALQKDYGQAINLRKEVYAFLNSIHPPPYPEIAITYDNIGVDFREAGQLDSSLFYHQKAIQILNANDGYQDQIANIQINLADTYIAQDEWEKAREEALKALETQKEIKGEVHADVAYSLNTLAQVALGQGQNELALQYAHAAVIANNETLKNEEGILETPTSGYFRYDYYFESIMLKATALQKLGQEPDALQQYMVADKVLVEARNRLLSREDKLHQSQNVYRLTTEAIELCMNLAAAKDDPEYLQTAFFFAEKSKASVLLQSINANNAKRFAGIPDTLIAREEQLQSDINYYSLQLAAQPDSTQIPLFQAELLTARAAYKELIDGFERDFPLYYELRYADHTPDVKAIQIGLPAGTALISYFTTDSTLFTFYLDSENYRVYRSDIDELFLDQITGFRKSIAQQMPFVYVELAQALYPKLFPFELPPSIGQLILIPDGQLTSLPFEALLTGEIDLDAELFFHELPYLLKNYVVSYAPSASLYHQFSIAPKAANSNTGTDLIAFAPVFSEKAELAANTRTVLEQLGAQQRTYTKDGDYITPLPATADELTAIYKVFTDNKLSGSLYTFAQANEVQMKNAVISQCRYLHIATHGFINEEFPDLSGLLLYPDTSNVEDDILNSGEVYSLKLNADLVVLSACETGIGKINTGEGILGLSRAFIYAGADNLIVSLWKVDDRATSELMTSFYQTHLEPKQRMPFAEALRAAKLAMIGSEQFSMPYYWSSFVLIGQ
jgi:CHAT domain-containing protein/Tfp pilus assembly protein PilF